MNQPDPQPVSLQNSKKAAVNEHSLHSTILVELQNRIRRGNWLPGERLPSIAQLAKEFHVGAGSIREALRSLQSIGLIKIEHGSGVYVTGTQTTTGLAGHFQKADAGLHIALAETRSVLEPMLAAFAADRATDEELSEIVQLVPKMEEAYQHGGDFAELDVLFHRKIASAARNPILFQTMEGVSNLFLESRKTILLDPVALLRALRYHTLIADALSSRNAPQARLLMQGHMNSMMDELLASETHKELQDKQNSSPEELI